MSDSSHLRLADRSCMASWTRSETTLRLDRQGPAAGALQSARKHRRSGCLLSVGSKAPSFRLPLPRTFETYCRDGRRPRPLAGWRRAGTLLSRCCLIRLYRVLKVNRRAEDGAARRPGPYGAPEPPKKTDPQSAGTGGGLAPSSRRAGGARMTGRGGTVALSVTVLLEKALLNGCSADAAGASSDAEAPAAAAMLPETCVDKSGVHVTKAGDR